jgi:hypothetical protein
MLMLSLDLRHPLIFDSFCLFFVHLTILLEITVIRVICQGDYFELSVALKICGILLMVIVNLRFERYLHVRSMEILLKLV